jgi:hypothetical protein
MLYSFFFKPGCGIKEDFNSKKMLYNIGDIWVTVKNIVPVVCSG